MGAWGAESPHFNHCSRTACYYKIENRTLEWRGQRGTQASQASRGQGMRSVGSSHKTEGTVPTSPYEDFQSRRAESDAGRPET